MFAPEVFLEKLRRDLNNVSIERITFRTISGFYEKFCHFFQVCNGLKEEQVQQLAECSVAYIECIQSYVENNSVLAKQQVENLKQFIQIVGDIPKLKGIKNEYIKWIVTPLFEKVIESDRKSWFAKEVLKNYIRAVQGTRKNLRNEIAEQNIVYMCKLADLLSVCGDYDYQVTLMETIFRMFSKEQINYHAHTLFPESEILQNGIRNVTAGHNFDVEMRVFLNIVNSDFKHILSIKCDYVLLGDTQVGAPKDTDKNQLPLWVDFNIEAETITFFCDQDSLKTSSSTTESGDWETVTINFSNITHVFASRLLVPESSRCTGSGIYFKLIPPCTVLYSSSYEAAQATDLKLAIFKCPELTQLETELLPKMFGERFIKYPTSSQENNLQPKKKGKGSFTTVYKPLKTELSICRSRLGGESSSASDAMSLKKRLEEVDSYSFDKQKKFKCRQSPKIFNIEELKDKYSKENIKNFDTKNNMVVETETLDFCDEIFDEAKSPESHTVENSKFESDIISIDGSPIKEINMQRGEASDNNLQFMHCTPDSLVELEFATSFEQIEKTNFVKEQSMNQKCSVGKEISSTSKTIPSEGKESKNTLCASSNYRNSLNDNLKVVERIELLEENTKEESCHFFTTKDTILPQKNLDMKFSTSKKLFVDKTEPLKQAKLKHISEQKVSDNSQTQIYEDKENSSVSANVSPKETHQHIEVVPENQTMEKVQNTDNSSHCKIIKVIDYIGYVDKNKKGESDSYTAEDIILLQDNLDMKCSISKKVFVDKTESLKQTKLKHIISEQKVSDNSQTQIYEDKENSSVCANASPKETSQHVEVVPEDQSMEKVQNTDNSSHCKIVKVMDYIDHVDENKKEPQKNLDMKFSTSKKLFGDKTEPLKQTKLLKSSVKNLKVPKNLQQKPKHIISEKKVNDNSQTQIYEDKENSSICANASPKETPQHVEVVPEDQSMEKVQNTDNSSHCKIVKVMDYIDHVDENKKEPQKNVDMKFSTSKKLFGDKTEPLKQKKLLKSSVKNLKVPKNLQQKPKHIISEKNVNDNSQTQIYEDKENSSVCANASPKETHQHIEVVPEDQSMEKLQNTDNSSHCKIVKVMDYIDLVDENKKESQENLDMKFSTSKKLFVDKTEPLKQTKLLKSSAKNLQVSKNLQQKTKHIISEQKVSDNSQTQIYEDKENSCVFANASLEETSQYIEVVPEDQSMEKVQNTDNSSHCKIVKVMDYIDHVDETKKEESCYFYTAEDAILPQEDFESNCLDESIKCNEKPTKKNHKRTKSSREIIKVKWVAPKCSISKTSLVDKSELLKQKKMLKSSVGKFETVKNFQQKPKHTKSEQKVSDNRQTQIYEDKENSLVCANASPKETHQHIEVVPEDQSMENVQNTGNPSHCKIVKVMDYIDYVDENKKEPQKNLDMKFSTSQKLFGDKTEPLKQTKLLKSSVKNLKIPKNLQQKPKHIISEKKVNDNSQTQIYEDKENSLVCANASPKETHQHVEVVPEDQSMEKLQNADNSSHCKIVKVMDYIDHVDENKKESQENLDMKFSTSKKLFVDKTEPLKQTKLLKSSAKKLTVSKNLQQKPKHIISEQKVSDNSQTQIYEDKENSSVFANASLKETPQYIEVVPEDQSMEKVQNTDNSSHCKTVKVMDYIDHVDETKKEESCYFYTAEDTILPQEDFESKCLGESIKCNEKPTKKNHKRTKSSREIIKVKWVAPKCSISKTLLVDKSELLKQKKLLKSSIGKFKTAKNFQQKPKHTKSEQKVSDNRQTQIFEDKENLSACTNVSPKETHQHIEVVHEDQTMKKVEYADNSLSSRILTGTKQNEILKPRKSSRILNTLILRLQENEDKDEHCLENTHGLLNPNESQHGGNNNSEINPKSSEPVIVDDHKTIKKKFFRGRASKIQDKNYAHEDANKIRVIKTAGIDVDNTLPNNKTQFDSNANESQHGDNNDSEINPKSSELSIVDDHKAIKNKSCRARVSKVQTKNFVPEDVNKICISENAGIGVEDNNLPNNENQSTNCTALEHEANTSTSKTPERESDYLFALAKMSIEEEKTEDTQLHLEKSTNILMNNSADNRQPEGIANKNEGIIHENASTVWVPKKCCVLLSQIDCRTALLKNTANNIIECPVVDLSDDDTELDKTTKLSILQNRSIEENRKETPLKEKLKEHSVEKNKPTKQLKIEEGEKVAAKTEKKNKESKNTGRKKKDSKKIEKKNKKSHAFVAPQNQHDKSQNLKIEDEHDLERSFSEQIGHNEMKENNSFSVFHADVAIKSQSFKMRAVEPNLEPSCSKQQEYNAVDESKIVSIELAQKHDIGNYDPPNRPLISKTQETVQIHVQKTHNTTVENELISKQQTNDSLMPSATAQSEVRASQKRKSIDNEFSDGSCKPLTKMYVATDEETPKPKKASKKGVTRRLFNPNSVYVVNENKVLVIDQNEIINTENSVQDKDMSECNDLIHNDDFNLSSITRKQKKHTLKNELSNNINELSDSSNNTAQNLSHNVSEINIETPRRETARQQINSSEKISQANIFEQLMEEKASNSVIDLFNTDAVPTVPKMDDKLASNNRINSKEEHVLKTSVSVKNTSQEPSNGRDNRQTFTKPYGTSETNTKQQKAPLDYLEVEHELFLFNTDAKSPVKDSKVANINNRTQRTEGNNFKTPDKNVSKISQPPKKRRKKETRTKRYGSSENNRKLQNALSDYPEKEDKSFNSKKQSVDQFSNHVLNKSKFELCMESILDSFKEIDSSSHTHAKKAKRSLKNAKYKSLKSTQVATTHKPQQLKTMEKEKKVVAKNIQQSRTASPLSYNPLKKTVPVMTTPGSNVKNINSSIDISINNGINGTVNHSGAAYNTNEINHLSVVENLSSTPSSIKGTKRKLHYESGFARPLDELIVDWVKSGSETVAVEGLKFVSELMLHQHKEMYEVLLKILLPLRSNNDQDFDTVYNIANECNRILKTYHRKR